MKEKKQEKKPKEGTEDILNCRLEELFGVTMRNTVIHSPELNKFEAAEKNNNSIAASGGVSTKMNNPRPIGAG